MPAIVVVLSGRAAYVVGWCGIRGTVTLAAALALPVNFRTAMSCSSRRSRSSFVTLVIQGMTLRPLIALLGVRDDGTVET